MGMDVSFISELTESERVIRLVDAGVRAPVQEGDAAPARETLCRRVADGMAPSVLVDTSSRPDVLSEQAAREADMAAYLSVPIELSDGHVYGTLCSYSTAANPTLNERDVALMRAFAEIAALDIEQELERTARLDSINADMQKALAPGALRSVYQPIVQLSSGSVAGYEALARFDIAPRRSPDQWFVDAQEVGVADRLERLAVQTALGALDVLPPDVYVGVNLSPTVAASGALDQLLERVEPDRVLLEITEHAVVEQYAALTRVLRPWRERGVRIAVDDAGAGYASFRHIISLAPDVIKLDMSLTRNVHRERPRRALAAALIKFAAETSCSVVAEGVECEDERDALFDLGVTLGQGYFFGKPQPLPAVTGETGFGEAFRAAGRHPAPAAASLATPASAP